MYNYSNISKTRSLGNQWSITEIPLVHTCSTHLIKHFTSHLKKVQDTRIRNVVINFERFSVSNTRCNPPEALQFITFC